MERNLSVRIAPALAGVTLLDALTRRFTYRNREQWQQELAAGRLHLNHRPAGAGDLLTSGDLLVYRMEPREEPPVNLSYQVLHEDSELLVVNKPAPLPCHPGGRYFHHTLWTLLRTRPGLTHPALVNRLDRETSGLVLVAKSPEAARACQAQFARRSVDKRYLVLVEGEFPAGETEAKGGLTPDSASLVRKKWRFWPAGPTLPPGALECRTIFRLLAAGHGLSLLEARPFTGRCHQIRATLCSLGFPVAGDKLYGIDERLFLRLLEDRLTDGDRKRLRLDCQALHAAFLQIRHPATGRALTLAAPPPLAFQEILARHQLHPAPEGGMPPHGPPASLPLA